MNHTTPCDLTVAPRPDSPALQAAFDAISRDARRTVIELTKSAARGFLALDTRWRLNLLWRGLEVTDPEEALAVLHRVAASEVPTRVAADRHPRRPSRLPVDALRREPGGAGTRPGAGDVSEWSPLPRVASVVVYLAAARQARLCPSRGRTKRRPTRPGRTTGSRWPVSLAAPRAVRCRDWRRNGTRRNATIRDASGR